MGQTIVLTAILGNFDTPVDPVEQTVPYDFHRWTDEDFPPIIGLTARFQYRIPKMFGWQMKPGYDTYVWLDGTWTFQEPDCLEWYLNQLEGYDIGFFAHPNRRSIEEEVQHIDDYLNRRRGTKNGQDYLISRYQNGLHKEQFNYIQEDEEYKDNKLYASTMFVYKNSRLVQQFLADWFLYQARYFTCDQVPLPYLLWKWKLKVKTFDAHIYKNKYLTEVSKHE